MENKKYIIALTLFIIAGLLAGAQNKFQISNLKIEHSVNKDGNIDARITFTYKQTEGYVDKVTPRLAVDGNVIRSSYQGGFNGGALRLESNGVLNLRTGMEEMPKDLSTNTLISKLNDGKHTLSVKLEGYTSNYGNKFIAIESNVATVDFLIGEKGSSTPQNNNHIDNSSNGGSTEDEIVVLTDEIGSDIIQFFWDPAQTVNKFGEVWIDTITSNNGTAKTKEYIFQQIASYEIPDWEKDKHPNVKQYGDRYITSSIYNMRYKFVVMRGSVYFDRSNGRVATAPNTVAYIDEFQKGEGAEGDSHWRTLVLQANKYYRGNELHILVIDYFSEPLIFPKAGVKASFEVKTPTATASVRGTEYEVIVLPNGQSEFYLYEGALEVKNSSGSVLLKPGEMISVRSKNDPLKVIPFNSTQRLNSDWSKLLGQIPSGNNFTGKSSVVKRGTNPLFANVTIGGTSWVGNNGNNTVPPPPSSGKPQSCIDQMQVQFIQKTGAVNDPQGRMIMMKIDDENKRELFWFNQAADNYKRGVFPHEMSGTYRRQQNPSPLSREYYCETITLFEPMKITNPTGNSHGLKIMRGMVEFQKFNSNQEAEGVVLPCGSYKVYPSDDMPFSAARFQLVRIQ